ncbi:ANTAR domain-containing protein [Streptomyces boninensis]|uniref:ANTAR domain-containing protein n=1 Tax=Streptomyces boninensis TaxID=2039455 RepID=UPI003B2107BF
MHTATSPAARMRWPRYAARAQELGYGDFTALPLRSGEGRDQVLGALVLLAGARRPLSAGAAEVGESLAEAAAIALLRERTVAEGRVLAGQLQHALSSRVVIEQAKGILAARLSITVEEAFAQLRTHARSARRRMADVAREVVGGAELPRAEGAEPRPTAPVSE